MNRHRKGQPGGNSPGLTIQLPLIGLSGQSGAGKSTLAELLSGACNISRMSFATSIREAAVIAFGDFLNQKYFTEWKDTSLPTHLINNLNNDLLRINLCHNALCKLVANGHPVPTDNAPLGCLSMALRGSRTPRDILCALGTWFCKEVAQNYWIEQLEKRIGPNKNNILIDDVRLSAEREWILSHGGCLILIVKKGQRKPPLSAHITERDFGHHSEYSFIVKAKHGDIDGLLKQSITGIGKWLTVKLHRQANNWKIQNFK